MPLNIENMRIIRDYLTKLPKDYEHFDLRSYTQKKCGSGMRLRDASPDTIVSCGTTACAIGHAILAGIPPLEDEFSWTDYGERITGLDDRDFDQMMLYNSLFCYGKQTHHHEVAHQIDLVIQAYELGRKEAQNDQ